MKTPWGRNDGQEGGERLDEHAQPGTGSTDFLGSLAFLYLFDRNSAVFASSGYRHTGENDFGYRYGTTFLANVAYEHKLGKALDGVVELNFRHAQKDRVERRGHPRRRHGRLPALRDSAPAGQPGTLVLRAAVQIPLARDLNGFQNERAVANGGVTYLFARN